MYKSLVLLCVVFCVVIEARPKWQFLPPKPGYVPVYIRAGDTPLEEINLELAEAFHALPAGRSAGKQLDASPETPELAEQPQSDEPQPDEPQSNQPESDEPESDEPQPAEPQTNQPQSDEPQSDQPQSDEPQSKQPEIPDDSTVDRRPYEKKFLEKKTKKPTEILKPIERR